MIDYSKIESDNSLLKLSRNGDSAALNYLLNKYKPLVIKTARDFFLTGGDSDDLIQEGMIGLFNATNDFDISSNVTFFHFANICIRRQLMKAIESDNTKKNAPLNNYVSISIDEDDSENLSFENNDPAHLIIRAEESLESLDKLKKELSPFEKSVFEYYLNGYDYNEIAAALGREPKEIDNAKSRIKAKAKKIHG